MCGGVAWAGGTSYGALRFPSICWGIASETAVWTVVRQHLRDFCGAPHLPPTGYPRHVQEIFEFRNLIMSIAALEITPNYYLVVGALLFTIGAVGLLLRRNVLVMFMCVELMLNAANLTFVTFSRALNDIGGQVIVFFTLVVAAAEVAVGLAIIVAIFRRRRGATADDVHLLRG